jgi:hypothetical protein
MNKFNDNIKEAIRKNEHHEKLLVEQHVFSKGYDDSHLTKTKQDLPEFRIFYCDENGKNISENEYNRIMEEKKNNK